MLAAKIEAFHAEGKYLYGETVKELQKLAQLPSRTSEGREIVDGEMYFVNEHGIWLVE